MRGEQLELERIASELRRRSQVTSDAVVMSPTLAERILGVPVAVAPTLRTSACLARVGKSYRVFIRAVGPDTNFDIAHELGHYGLRVIAGYQGPDEERLANRVAACLLAPREIVQSVVRTHGRALRSIRPLARTVRISQTAAQLRLGEILEDERAVVTKTGNVLLRSQGTLDWSTIPVVAVARGDVAIEVVRERDLGWRGLARARLRGGIDEGRVALRAK